MAAADPEVARASHMLGSYSPRLKLDLEHLAPYDSKIADLDRAPSLGKRLAIIANESGPHIFSYKKAYSNLHGILLSGHLNLAIDSWAPRLGIASITSIGARSYSKDEQDLMRNTQRLLPLHEVDLDTAIRTAVADNSSSIFWLSLDLTILEPHLTPAVMPIFPGGASLSALRSALAQIPGSKVVGFEVIGLPKKHETNLPTILTAVELLRDNILAWWG